MRHEQKLLKKKTKFIMQIGIEDRNLVLVTALQLIIIILLVWSYFKDRKDKKFFKSEIDRIDFNSYDIYHKPTNQEIAIIEDLSECNSNSFYVKLTLKDGSIVTETKEKNIIYIKKNER